MASSNPVLAGSPQSFTEPAHFDAEMAQVFRKSWICVGHVSQLRNAGDYVTADLFGAPIVVIRGKDDELRALSNVCLHRAMPIAEGTGNTHVLTCPYHLWAYDLDGQLKSTPLLKPEDGIDVSQYRLPCLAIEEWQGFVFVCRDRNAPPLADQLAPLAEVIAPQKFDQLVHAGSLEFPSPWNWKVLVENFMEAYHHIGPHRDTLQPALPALKSSMMELGGPFSVLQMLPVDEGHSPLWAGCIYPNMLFACQPESPAPFLTWYQMTNMHHDHFDLTVHVFLPEDAAADPETVEGAIELTKAIHQEDIAMCDGVQTGLQSPYAIHGPLAPRLEAPLSHFRAWLDQKLAD